MKSNSTPARRHHTAGATTTATLALLLSLGAAGGNLQAAIVDDFNDGNDLGWTHYDPIGGFGVSASYSFPNGGYRMTIPAFSHPQLGYSRSGSLRMGTSFSEFHSAVDVTEWTGNVAFGLVARIGNVGLGQTTGYTFNYNAGVQRLFINFFVGEVPWYYVGTDVALTLDPQRQYRMTFAGAGNDLTGAIFDLANPALALASVTITDHVTTKVPDGVSHSPYPSGVSGLLLAGASGGSVTYDNFSVSAVPEPTSTAIVGLGLAGLAAWRLRGVRRQQS